MLYFILLFHILNRPYEICEGRLGKYHTIKWSSTKEKILVHFYDVKQVVVL